MGDSVKVDRGKRKPKVLFVGGFRKPVEGGVIGGQTLACQFLVESPLSANVEWSLLDSTQESLPPPPVVRRAWLAMIRLGRFLRRLMTFRPDAVLLFCGNGLSFCEKGAMAAIARLFKRRVVLCPRSGLLLSEYEQSRFMRWFIPRVLRCASSVVCQGREWQTFFERASGLPAARLPVIWNSLRARDYTGTPNLHERSRVVVLFLGWVERNKGLHELVEAVSLFRDDLSGVRFVICGEGSEMAALRHRILDAGIEAMFEFRGWVRGEAKMRALDECDLLVLPSHREGFPNVLLEAMASGRPVLASAVGAVPDLVIPERTGLLCESCNARDLGEKLVRLCHDAELRARLAVAGQQRVLEHHDIDRIWTRWWAVLTDGRELETETTGPSGVSQVGQN